MKIIQLYTQKHSQNSEQTDMSDLHSIPSLIVSYPQREQNKNDYTRQQVNYSQHYILIDFQSLENNPSH